MSPYYADPSRPAGVRWVNPYVCRTCDDPVPVAASLGVPHPLGEYLCVQHVLEAVGAATRLKADAPVLDGAVRAAFRAALRVQVARPDPTTAATLERQAPLTPLEPELLAAAVLTMGMLGAVPLRTERTFGVPVAMGCHWKPPTPKAEPRKYEAGQPAAWDQDGEARTWPAPAVLESDDEAVPKAARALAKVALKAGWDVRLTAAEPTLILRATRGPALALVRYERGRQASAWLRIGRTAPVALDAKRLGAILRTPGA